MKYIFLFFWEERELSEKIYSSYEAEAPNHTLQIFLSLLTKLIDYVSL